MITFHLNLSIYTRQKNQLSNDYMLGNAVYVHFWLILTCFWAFLVQLFEWNCPGYHIFHKAGRVKGVGSKKCNWLMIKYWKLQFLPDLNVLDFYFCLWSEITYERLDQYSCGKHHSICLKKFFIFVTNFLNLSQKTYELWPKTCRRVINDFLLQI